MSFLDKLWKASEPVYQQIIDHPYNKEIAQGTLKNKRFKFYISQDVIYINQYAKALALLAGRMQDAGKMYEFITFAKEGLDIERALHHHYLKYYNVKPASESSLATEAYGNFLLTTATLSTPAEAISALLPCFWLYGKVAEHIYKNSQENNPYQKWIDTYAGAEFDETTERLKEITREFAEESNEKTKERMKYYFVRSSKYEWFCWDNAYHMRM